MNTNMVIVEKPNLILKFETPSNEVAAFASVSVFRPPAARAASSSWPGASWRALIGGHCA